MIPTDNEVAAARLKFQGLVVKGITGITQIADENYFKIEFMNQTSPDLILSKIANLLWPSFVIKFYEDKINDNLDQIPFLGQENVQDVQESKKSTKARRGRQKKSK